MSPSGGSSPNGVLGSRAGIVSLPALACLPEAVFAYGSRSSGVWLASVTPRRPVIAGGSYFVDRLLAHLADMLHLRGAYPRFRGSRSSPHLGSRT